MARIAIHGFGRIGRSLMKVALKNDLFVPVSISDIKDLAALAALFEVDSNYGRWPEEVSTKDNCFVIGGVPSPTLIPAEGRPNPPNAVGIRSGTASSSSDTQLLNAIPASGMKYFL